MSADRKLVSPHVSGPHLRILANGSVREGPLRCELGQLTQDVLDGADAAHGSVAIELNFTSDAGVLYSGGPPPEVITIVALFALVRHEALRVADYCFDAAVKWAMRNRRRDGGKPIIVELYGPDGQVIHRVTVPQDGSESSLVEPADLKRPSKGTSNSGR
jgi:hypothetical protein